MMPDVNSCTRIAAKQAYEMAGLGPNDIDLVELHDCFATAEILHYENLGLCKDGEAGRLIDTGAIALGGRIPVNVSGGLLSKGHPLGATGIANIYEVTTHLRGEAGKRQVEGARIGMTHVIGLGSACGIHILEKVEPNRPDRDLVGAISSRSFPIGTIAPASTMRIGIVSDTHNNLRNVARIVELFNAAHVDRVIHTGDITQAKTLAVFRHLTAPLYGVFGNNDQERDSLEAAIARNGFVFREPPLELEWHDRRIIVVHDPLELDGSLRDTHMWRCTATRTAIVTSNCGMDRWCSTPVSAPATWVATTRSACSTWRTCLPRSSGSDAALLAGLTAGGRHQDFWKRSRNSSIRRALVPMSPTPTRDTLRTSTREPAPDSGLARRRRRGNRTRTWSPRPRRYRQPRQR